MPKKLEVIALFLRLIQNENRGFRKRSSNQKNLKTPALRFTFNKRILKTELILVRRHHNHVTSLAEFSGVMLTATINMLLVRTQINTCYYAPKCV